MVMNIQSDILDGLSLISEPSDIGLQSAEFDIISEIRIEFYVKFDIRQL